MTFPDALEFTVKVIVTSFDPPTGIAPIFFVARFPLVAQEVSLSVNHVGI